MPRPNSETCSDCMYLLEVRAEDSSSAESEYFCMANPEMIRKSDNLIGIYKCRFYKYRTGYIKLCERL